MKLFPFLWLATFSLAFTIQQNTATDFLSGVVVNQETTAPLSNVTITVYAGDKAIETTKTDAKGAYRIPLEKGEYDLEFSLPEYETLRMIGLRMEKGIANNLNVSLSNSLLPHQRTTRLVSAYSPRVDIKEIDLETVEIDDAIPTPEPVDPVVRSDEEVVYEVTFESETYEEKVVVKSASKATKAEETLSAPSTTAFKVDLIKKDETTGSARPDEKAKAEPRKTTAKVAAASKAAPIDAGAVTIRGSRSSDADYHIDGVRVAGAPPSPAPEPAVFMAVSPAPSTTTPKPAPAQPAPKAGLLTAGEWNDLDNWAKHWTDLLTDGEIDAHQTMYGFYPRHRYSVLLQNKEGFPIVDASVTLTEGQGAPVWEARTDNTGKAELWYALNEKTEKAPKLNLTAWIDGKKHALGTAKPFAEGINQHQINRECRSSKLLDIVWAVDATGSMSDEIDYLKTELYDVIGRVKSSNPNLTVRMGSVFYRDDTDDYLVKSSGLSPDISRTVDYIKEQYADGGGDTPEAVHSALEEAIYRQKWSDEAVARICFLVLDASPHQTPEINASLQRTIREAARKGIRIVPVSASGIQKDTEFLMKFFGLATNGSYVFLTDHSGIGGKHIEATTDEYKVEALNNLLVRLITQYSNIETCDGKSLVLFERNSTDSTATAAIPPATYYPNPAVDQVTLELPFDAPKVTLYNSEGVAVWSLANAPAGTHTIPVRQFPAGYYTLRMWKEDQVQSGKVLVVKM